MPLDVVGILELAGAAITGAFGGGTAIVVLTKTFWKSRMEDRENVDTRIDEELAKMRESIDSKHRENIKGREEIRDEVHEITDKLDNRYVLNQVFNTHISEMGRRLVSLEAKNDQILAGVLDLLRDKRSDPGGRHPS